MKTIESFTRRWLAVALLLLAVPLAVAAQDAPLKLNYRLSMSHPATHLFEVAIEVELPSDVKPESLDLQMPKWSPGRYAVFDFAKTVQEFHAFLGRCNPRADCTLPNASVTRVDDQTWRVSM